MWQTIGDDRRAPTSGEFSLRQAVAADAPVVTALVNAAFGHYISRIGRPPAPMTYDYAKVIVTEQVTVAESGGQIAGLLVAGVTGEGFLIINVAVDPGHRGKGLGKALLEYAESQALRAGFDSIYLFTHEKMTENQTLYAAIGYVEYDRRSQGNFSLVFMRKSLG